MPTIDATDVLGWRHQLSTLALSPAGDRVLVGGDAREAPLYDAASGALLATLRHYGGINAALFLPDGGLVTASDDMGVRFWDADGSLRALARGHLHEVQALALCGGGSVASASVDGSVRWWSADGDEQGVDPGHDGLPRALAFAHGRLALGTDAGAVVYDGHQRRASVVLPDGVRAVAWSPDGGVLVAVGWRGTLHLLTPDLRVRASFPGQVALAGPAADEVTCAEGARLVVRDLDGHVRRTLGEHDGVITCLARLPDGGVLSGGDDACVRIWSPEGALVGENTHDHTVVRLAVAGATVTSAARNGRVQIWRASDASRPRRRAPAREPLWAAEAGEAVYSAGFSPDGTRCATSGPSGLDIWDAATGRRLAKLATQDPCGVPHWSAGALITNVPNQRCLRVWNAHSLEPLGELRDGDVPLVVAGDRVLSRALDSSRAHLDRVGAAAERLLTIEGKTRVQSLVAGPGTLAVVGLRGSGARLVDLASAAVTVLGEQGEVWRVEFAPDASLILTSGDAARLWRQNGERVAEFGPTSWAAFSPRGDRFALANRDGSVDLHRADAARVAHFDAVQRDELRGPSFSSDGALLAMACNNAAYLHDAGSGARIAALSGHASDHIWGAFTRDAQRVYTWARVTPCPDLVVRLWDRAGTLVAALPGHTGKSFWRVEASPSAAWLLTIVDQDDTPRLWRTADGSGDALRGHRSLVRAGEFSPDGSRVLTADQHGAIRMWSLT